MGKGKDIEEIEKIIISKPIIIIIIIFLLIPVFFSFYSISYHEKIKIGIVLTSDNLIDDGEVAKDALNRFENIFDAEILDIKFNESDVRIKNDKYLTDDYFDPKFAKMVRDKYDVEIVMILTNHKINNWQGDGKAIWGQADTKNSMTLVTNAQFKVNISFHRIYIEHISIHEALHLLGYQHPTDSRECIMQYASIDEELSDEFRLELPYRLTLWRIGEGKEFSQAVFLINLTLGFLLSTFIIPIMIIIQFIFKRRFYKRNSINQNPLIFGIGLYFVFLLFSSVIVSFYPRFVLIIISLFLYVIIEAIYFEQQSKVKKGSNEESDDNRSSK